LVLGFYCKPGACEYRTGNVIQNGSLVRKGWLFDNAKYRPHIKNHVTSYSRCVYSQGFAEDRL